jgi:general secretion pathway protein J
MRRGFTLLELVIAMTIMSLLSLALYGVVSLGATSAGAGERHSEQTRRFRVAVSVMLRQLRSAAPVYVAHDEKDDEEKLAEPYFIGEKDSLEFATASPQGPNAAGLAMVRYWLEDGKLMMSEMPYFLAYDRHALKHDAEALTLQAALLYDVKDVKFEFQRSEYESNQWDDSWDASDEDSLPAGVRVTVESELPSTPGLSYEVPIYVGVFNEITGEDDFRERAGHTPNVAGDDEGDTSGSAEKDKHGKNKDDTGDDDTGDEADEDLGD